MPRMGMSGTRGTLNALSTPGMVLRSIITAAQTSVNASRVPMLVISPATSAGTMDARNATKTIKRILLCAGVRNLGFIFEKNGGRSPIAGLVHSVTLLIILVSLMPLAKYIPLACLGAVLAVVSYNMGDWTVFAQMFKKKNKTQFIVMMITFVLTIFLDLVYAIIVGVVLYLIGISVLMIRKRKHKAVLSVAE